MFIHFVVEIDWYDETFDKLQFFVYNLVYFFETTFDSCLDIIGASTPISLTKKLHFKNDTILATQFLSFALQIDGLTSIVKSCFKKYENELIEWKKSKLAWLIYDYCDRGEYLRIEMIKAAVELFANYEPQFKYATSDASGKKAMQILAFEASFRLFSYLKNVEKNTKVDRHLFTKAIVMAKKKTLNCRVKFRNKDVKCVDLFDNVGIFDNNNNNPKYYKKMGFLGFRNKFQWEILEEDDVCKVEEEDEYCKLFTISCDDVLIEKIENYIISKNPYEQNRLETKEYHEQQMEDRKDKHNKLMKKLNEIHSDIKIKN